MKAFPFYFYFNVMTNLELFFKRKLTFIMDGIPKFDKEDTKSTTVNIDEIENNASNEDPPDCYWASEEAKCNGAWSCESCTYECQTNKCKEVSYYIK